MLQCDAKNIRPVLQSKEFARQIAGVVLHCTRILLTCLAAATTEDSREYIERFNWLISNNARRTGFTKRPKNIACGRGYTGQCSKKNRHSIAAIVLKSRTEFFLLQRLPQRKIARNVRCWVCYTWQFFVQLVSQENWRHVVRNFA